MELEGRTYWQMFILEALVWLVPMILALTGHFIAYPRAKLVMDGTVRAPTDAATAGALEAWRFMQGARWIFAVYGFAVFILFAIVRLKGVTLFWRALIFAAVAIPGFWYIGQTIRLVTQVALF